MTMTTDRVGSWDYNSSILPPSRRRTLSRRLLLLLLLGTSSRRGAAGAAAPACPWGRCSPGSTSARDDPPHASEAVAVASRPCHPVCNRTASSRPPISVPRGRRGRPRRRNDPRHNCSYGHSALSPPGDRVRPCSNCIRRGRCGFRRRSIRVRTRSTIDCDDRRGHRNFRRMPRGCRIPPRRYCRCRLSSLDDDAVDVDVDGVVPAVATMTRVENYWNRNRRRCCCCCCCCCCLRRRRCILLLLPRRSWRGPRKISVV